MTRQFLLKLPPKPSQLLVHVIPELDKLLADLSPRRRYLLELTLEVGNTRVFFPQSSPLNAQGLNNRHHNLQNGRFRGLHALEDKKQLKFTPEGVVLQQPYLVLRGDPFKLLQASEIILMPQSYLTVSPP